MGKNSPQAETPLIIFKARLKAFLPIIHSTLIKVEILIKIFFWILTELEKVSSRF